MKIILRWQLKHTITEIRNEMSVVIVRIRACKSAKIENVIACRGLSCVKMQKNAENENYAIFFIEQKD